MKVNARRRGLFWDVQAGRVAPPPAALLLGWELVAIDPEEGTIEVAFQAGSQFTNPVGVIQGGFLAAMLDDTLGPALVATLPENQFLSIYTCNFYAPHNDRDGPCPDHPLDPAHIRPKTRCGGPQRHLPW